MEVRFRREESLRASAPADDVGLFDADKYIAELKRWSGVYVFDEGAYRESVSGQIVLDEAGDVFFEIVLHEDEDEE